MPIIKFTLSGFQFDVLFAAVDDFKFVKRVLNQKMADSAQYKEEWRRLSETT